jgi:predicted RNA binding protein YcfA (HicA-like mRNA interferase family)
VKPKDVMKRLEREGWILARKSAGSHRSYTHPQRPGALIVVSDHGTNADIKPGTYHSIAKAAGWKK